MKIENSVKSTGGLPSSDGRTRATKDTTRTPPSGSDTDKVEISSLSSRLQQMEETVAGTPVVDSAKVDEIKQAMSQGRFKVDTGKVADGLIESVRQMLATQTGRA
ncbi:flagellar biosynthesis anti-sigma factor FlgM [Zoogloea sp. LCSB751]|uniref:flagellar biosynthesis anti-sigma factor FlgM n=1 Tax=Zoogloea sp. LCSB751 TaxID=1965277 RepID=UPI0009A4D5D2|nr:flagellar biosynthesis anti-sigma factor FlgM [Zoogloea sp. LCSB751]